MPLQPERFTPKTAIPDPDAPRGRVRQIVKLAFFFCTLAGLIILVHACDITSLMEPEWADAHLKSPEALYTAIALYLGLVALLSPLGIPRQALSALGGYSFGAVWGIVFASVGLTAGCCLGFFYSRLLARNALRAKFGTRIRKLDAFLRRNPFAMTVAVRFFPMGNNALTNLAAGVTTVSPLPFIAGSAVGYLPQTIIFALLGSGVRVDPFWRLAVSALLFVAATSFGLLLYRKFRGEQSGLPDPARQATLRHSSSPVKREQRP